MVPLLSSLRQDSINFQLAHASHFSDFVVRRLRQKRHLWFRAFCPYPWPIAANESEAHHPNAVVKGIITDGTFANFRDIFSDLVTRNAPWLILADSVSDFSRIADTFQCFCAGLWQVHDMNKSYVSL